VEAVVRRLLAVQAQDPRGARLTVRARSKGLVAADVDRALTNDRSVVVTWLNRGTLHLVCVEDLPLLQSLTTPQLRTGNARRLAQEGVSARQAERGTEVVLTALEDGPKTRSELREVLVSAGVPVAGQALVHVLFRTTLLGSVVRGPLVDADQAFVLVRDWLGAPAAAPPDRGAALTELARRYLEGHGPARDRDLARWAGISLGDARRGLGGVRGLHEVDGGLVSLSRARTIGLPPPRLLGPFEPLLLGWADRTPIVGDRGDLVTSNGIFRPFALVDGRAVGSWSLARGLQPFEPLAPDVTAALDADAADVRRFLGTRRYR
jgi:Winged helix DNA-binding domain